MARRFEGLSDLEWKLFEDMFPKEPEKRGKGMPHAPYRYVLNSLLYILITGCRWCALPQGDRWTSKSSSHRWLKRWREDGTLEHLQARVLEGVYKIILKQVSYYDYELIDVTLDAS